MVKKAENTGEFNKSKQSNKTQKTRIGWVENAVSQEELTM